MIRAFCYASGHIEFGKRVPSGAIVIARGPEKQLRDFISGVARHGYDTKLVNGRRTKIPGSDTLLVPGVPEAPNEWKAENALENWAKWISTKAPADVRVLPR